MNKSIIEIFSHHKVAANLLMFLMLFAGFWGLTKLNVQFLPNFNIPVITINVVWPGGSAEDVRRSVTKPIELELKSLKNIKKITSSSAQNRSGITLEFEDGTDMIEMVAKVRDRVDQVRQLPTDIEKPIITHIETYEPVARVLISGPDSVEELRLIIYQFEQELLRRGISKIAIDGLPEQEMAIQISTDMIHQLKRSLPEIAHQIRERSKDITIGTMGKRGSGQPVRSENQRRSELDFYSLPLLTDEHGQYVQLRDVAQIDLRPKADQPSIEYQGKPAVQLTLLREENANALEAANILHAWQAETQATFGDSIHIKVYNETWLYIKERIQLLLKNGSSGLVLILLVLFLFLNSRVAFWVAMGIPASFMAALAIIYGFGDSINMISLFALIMTLGIIVDDTIVVGEETLTVFHKTKDTDYATSSAAKKMVPPIFAASLTTIATFLPLLIVSNVIGQVIRSIPIVVICVILASLVECFLVLPGHLRHSLKKSQKTESNYRIKINRLTKYVTQIYFRRFVRTAIHYRYATMMGAIAILFISVSLIINGYIPFNFFPSPEDRIIYADIQFISGTNRNQMDNFLDHIQVALDKTVDAFPKEKDLVQVKVIYRNQLAPIDPNRTHQGEQYASILLECKSPEERTVTNSQIIKEWLGHIELVPSVESLVVSVPRAGPPGKDLDIRLQSEDPVALAAAAVDLTAHIEQYSGVSNLINEMGTNHQEIIFELTKQAKAIGLTEQMIGSQIRAAISGDIVQLFHDSNEEIEVRVVLPDEERDQASILSYLPIVTANHQVIPLPGLINWHKRTSPDVFKNYNSRLTTHVTADLDTKVTTTDTIIQSLNNTILPDLVAKYGVSFGFEGRAEEQQETFNDMLYGIVIGVCLIYFILAWVFSSYFWPFLVMSVIPLGLSGAILGHLVLGLDMTILSLLGFFGLSGIVVNDSIILMNEYKHLRVSMPMKQAIIEASCRRLRAVLLTSLTTIAGLGPLLFERSLQAQFLIPMAASIAFGLLYATLLILIFIPALLYTCESIRRHISTKSNNLFNL